MAQVKDNMHGPEKQQDLKRSRIYSRMKITELEMEWVRS